MPSHRPALERLALFSIFLLLRTSFAAEPPQAPAPAQLGLINIVIIEGDEQILNVRQRVHREAIVQVEDENHKPIAGALVTFTSPQNGASATFANGSHTFSVLTDEQGRAALRGIEPNKATGKFQIRINANKDGRTASASLTISNLLPPGGSAATAGLSGKAIAGIIAIGAVALGVGLGLGLGSGGSVSPVGGPIVLQPGTPSVSGPH